MAYVTIPKDLTKVKTKVMFNLTKRQLICFAAAAAVGSPLYFLLRSYAGNSTAAMCMILVMLPFFLLAVYEKNGRPLERVIHDMIQVLFIRPKQRPYKTRNFYAVLERQEALEQEVQSIVCGTQQKIRGISSGANAAGQQKAEPHGAEAD